MSHFGAGITLDGQGFVLTIAGDSGNTWPGLFPCSVSCYNMGFDPNNQVLAEGATWLYEKGVEPSATDCWNVRDPKPKEPEEPKPDEPKPDEPKPDEPKPEEPKPEEPDQKITVRTKRAKGTFPYQILHTRMSANKRPTL